LSLKVFGVALTAAVLGATALAGPAAAALNNPSPVEEKITVFPSRDFVALDHWEPNTDVHVRVLRNGFEAGSAVGTTDAAGFVEVNHPGGVCFVALG
jgi:hypothetical protein